MNRDGECPAFVCLRAKRSGDIYTPTDLALLGAVMVGWRRRGAGGTTGAPLT